MKKRTALVLGASGLIGSELVKQLANSPYYEKVTLLVRKTLSIEHSTIEQVEVDFDALDEHTALFKVDDVYSVLGTTIKKAKSKEQFKKVDYTYTLKAAKLAKQEGATTFLTVTSLGAKSTSLFFYSRVKGEVEKALQELKLPSVHIFQPSLLLGHRKEWRQGERLAESIAKRTSFLFKGPFEKYKPIEAKVVAQRMYETALKARNGYHVYPSDLIQKGEKSS
ncbi:NAD(P)H-binding protein [Metabacillus iocasae]|uniref:Uncharacterized protein YbjT (DUF2867 family) n=1 Tax=Priestia iocasae TaxID=2291674 RepID=A0ABS2QZY9_9BACI|nr:NAD(P)H-binding protein [Metabacillus iocasae]MBM7705043.1 uncharacterized protein YbjT (DUF2867 family) [Metabacillus iocasae]